MFRENMIRFLGYEILDFAWGGVIQSTQDMICMYKFLFAMNMNLNTPRSLPATVTTSHFSGFAGRDVSNKMVQSFAMFVFFSWTPKLRGKHTCPLTNNFYTLKCHKCTSVTSVLKTDCRKKRGSCTEFVMWQQVERKIPALKETKGTFKRCNLECFKVAFLDGQLSVFKFEPPAHLWYVLNIGGWWMKQRIRCFGDAQRIPNFQVKNDVATSINQDSIVKHAHVLLINLPSMVLFFDILLPE